MQHDTTATQLIEDMAAADGEVAARAWAQLAQGHGDLPVEIQQAALAAALRSGHRLVASTARGFMVEHWRNLPADVQRAALAALGQSLDDTRQAQQAWSFLATRWPGLPDAVAGLLSAQRVSSALAQHDVAIEAWELLTTHWDRLPAELTDEVTAPQLAAALLDPGLGLAAAAWDFLIENWPQLPAELRGVLDRNLMTTAARLAPGRLALAEFLTEHAALLSPESRQAAEDALSRSRD